MKMRFIRLTALLLAAVLMLSGCSRALLELAREELDGYLDTLTEPATGERPTVPTEEGELTFSQMEYVRPDMEKLEQVIEDEHLKEKLEIKLRHKSQIVLQNHIKHLMIIFLSHICQPLRQIDTLDIRGNQIRHIITHSTILDDRDKS